MAVTSLALRLQTLRESAGLTKTQLARRCGLSRPYLSQLERGSRSPSPACLQRIAAGLDVDVTSLLEGARYRAGKRGPRGLHKHRRSLAAIFSRCQPVLAPCKLHQAFKSACQTKLGLALRAEVDAQSRPAAFWPALKHMAEPLNSSEQLFVLHMLVAGADLEDLAPADVGFERSVVWNPLRRWLALVMKIDQTCLVMFPQLGATTRPGRYRTLDVLIVTTGRFIDGELDGYGHDAKRDADRDEEVQMTVMRIPVREVERPDFVERFIRSVRARCRNGERSAG